MKRKILSVLGVLVAVILSTAVLTGCNKTPAGDENSGGSGESMSESRENGVLTENEASKIIKKRYEELIDVCTITAWYEERDEIESDITIQDLEDKCYCLVDGVFLSYHRTLAELLDGDISYGGIKRSLLSLFDSFSFYTSQELLNYFEEIDGKLWFKAFDSENPHPMFINNYFTTDLLEIESITAEKISFSLGHELLAKEGKDVRVTLELVKNIDGEWVFNETLLNISAYAGPYWTGVGDI